MFRAIGRAGIAALVVLVLILTLSGIGLWNWGTRVGAQRGAEQLQTQLAQTPTATPWVIEGTIEVTPAAEPARIAQVQPTVQPAEERPTSTPVAATPTSIPRPTATAVAVATIGSAVSGSGVVEMPQTLYEDGTWRLQKAQTYSFGPQLGYTEPGFGTAEDEVGVVVGFELTLYTASGLQRFGGGCQQFAFPPGIYAKNMGGVDWGAHAYRWNPAITSWENEFLVLSWEAAKQQIQWESCPDLPDTELLRHVYVIEQDGQFAKATPWLEYRRPSGVDRTIMFGPGDTVYGWSIGLGNAYTGVPGQDGQDNLCLGGGCFLPVAPTWGWVGGGIVNSTWPGEIPDNAVPIPQTKIDQVMATLPD